MCEDVTDYLKWFGNGNLVVGFETVGWMDAYIYEVLVLRDD